MLFQNQERLASLKKTQPQQTQCNLKSGVQGGWCVAALPQPCEDRKTLSSRIKNMNSKE